MARKQNQILPDMDAIQHKDVKYTKALGQRIILELCSGKLLKEILNWDGSPSPALVRKWIIKNSEFKKEYDLALDMQADHWFEEAVKIAKATESGSTAKDRLIIDTLLKGAAIRKPKMYGEKKEIGMLVPVVINTSLDVPVTAVSTNEPYTVQPN